MSTKRPKAAGKPPDPVSHDVLRHEIPVRRFLMQQQTKWFVRGTGIKRFYRKVSDHIRSVPVDHRGIPVTETRNQKPETFS